MFEYFENRYVWNLSTNIALSMGGQMGEIDEASRPLEAAKNQTEHEATQAFFSGWSAIADRLIALARADEAAGRRLSAAAKYRRAWVYLLTCERMQAADYPPRKAAYASMLDCFGREIALSGAPCEIVTVPYGNTSFPALFVNAAEPGRQAPCVVLANGLDSTKEMIYGVGMPEALRRRGISSLIVDQPGTGGALRLGGLTAVVEAERWAAAAVDYLEKRSEVQADRVGMMGWSLGGYYAPRATAFEPRFKLCVAWGANHDFGEINVRRKAREGDRPVPHYWEHVCWVWNAADQDAFMELSKRITLEGILDRIRVPVLVTHGENDRQIPLEFARRTYAQLVNSPKRELKIFTPAEGGIEHCHLDCVANARDYIADWVSETFAGMAR